MSNRYSRHQTVINREKDAHIDDDYWFRQFEKNLEKSAVTSKRVDQSLYDQINSVMNIKSKYTSVSAAVEDMMQRSGLTAYLDNVKVSEENINKKVAEESAKEVKKNSKQVKPLLMSLKDGKNVLDFIKNRAESTKGSISVPALKETTRAVFNNKVSDDRYWEDPQLLIYIHNVVSDEKKKHHRDEQQNGNFGKIQVNINYDADPSNNDAFHILMPATK